MAAARSGTTGDDTIATVRVELDDRGYDILIGPGLIADAGQHIAPLMGTARCVIVTDENVAPVALDQLQTSLDAAGIPHRAIILPAGEKTKNFGQLETLVSDLLSGGIDRKGYLIALGGGVIGDLTGFAAAITLRGIDFIQIPTTLLAQVDSSVGGKTGINTPEGKNLAGAFHQPRLVLADTDILDSLPLRELRAGYAEVIKYGCIDRPDFFAWLEDNGTALLEGDAAARREAIRISCEAKAAIVAQDEREGGARALLNLGHTFGHALEAENAYGSGLLHGEAVAIGMVMAFRLSAKMGLCETNAPARLTDHLMATGLPVDLRHLDAKGWTADMLLGHMAKDKKVLAGQMTFILARGIGESFITRDVATDDVRSLLQEFLEQA